MSCTAAALRADDATSPPAPQGPSEPLGEHITRLFPKCRPKRDVNLNVASSLNAAALAQRRTHPIDNDRLIVADADASSDEDQMDLNMTTEIPQHINHNSKHGHYKFRDSRIIEIAGGREVYSQNRTKAVRKMRQTNNIHKLSQQHRHKHRHIKDVPAVHDIYSTENSNPHNVISPIEDYSRRQLTTTDQVCVNLPRESPPPLDAPMAQKHGHKGSPIAVVAGGEVVVFDDISDNWKGLRLDIDGSEDECVMKPVNGLIKSVTSGSSGSTPSRGPDQGSRGAGGGHSDASDASVWSENPGKVTRIIGGLPIAEYEGSPRRYGVAPPQSRSPRPGFPQRIPMNDSPKHTVQPSTVATTFDYLYEFSETRKVLEEFFRCPSTLKPNITADANDDLTDFQDLDYELRRQRHNVTTPEADELVPNEDQVNCIVQEDGQDEDSDTGAGSWYVGRRLASESPRLAHNHTNFLGLQDHDNYEQEVNLVELSVGTGSSGSGHRGLGAGLNAGLITGVSPGITTILSGTGPSARFALSPETTDCDSNCGDLDSEVSLMMDNDLRPSSCEGIRLPNSMPVLEDGLSSGHVSDNDNNNSKLTLVQIHKSPISQAIVENGVSLSHDMSVLSDADLNSLDPLAPCEATPPPPAPAPHRGTTPSFEPQSPMVASLPPSPPPPNGSLHDGEVSLHDVRSVMRGGARNINVDVVPRCDLPVEQIWVPRRRATSGESIESAERKPTSGDEDEADTDLETDRLLGQQRTDDQGFYDDKRKKRKTLSSAKQHQQQAWRKPRSRTVLPAQGGMRPTTQLSCQPAQVPGPVSPSSQVIASTLDIKLSPSADEENNCNTNGKKSADKEGKKKAKNKEVVHGGRRYSTLPIDSHDKKTGRFHSPEVLIEGVLFRARYLGSTQLACEGQPTKATRMMQAEEAVSRIKDCHLPLPSPYDGVYQHCHAEGVLSPTSLACLAPPPPPAPPVGTVFHLTFLGSVEVDEEGGGRRRRKRLKKTMVEEAVTKIKAPEGETQPSTEVDLFISTEKIMVLNTELKEIMMDHALRTISYIADIGDLVVLMARRRFVPHDSDSDPPKLNRTPKMICHVFESEEAQFIAQSIGQAFQVAYMEFLKANGIEDHSFVKEMDYQEVLNSQEIFGDELQMFAKKELQKEVVVPKTKGEILGVVVVESGWGSMLPTVVIANLAPAGAAARCGQLNIGDQIIAINGVSLVGLPLSTCQTYIKNSKNQTVVKLTVVPCPPVVEVKIKRPDTKYQLGFSVQNGVICSLLRGGIAERGGVRVGHRIIEINSQSVVAVPHERIVNLLATSVGEILMKTMPTSMFRLLTGQENPIYI